MVTYQYFSAHVFHIAENYLEAAERCLEKGPDEGGDAVNGLLWPSDLFRIIGRIWSLARSLPNEPLAEFERLLRNEPSTTEVERLRKERIGQNVFRSALSDYWEKFCAVTGVQNPTLLRASHIVPWAACESDEERLNVHNGLLLVATSDAAFDAGLITFEDDGRIRISGKLSDSDQISSGVGDHMRLIRMNDEVRKRLAWHRAHLFVG